MLPDKDPEATERYGQREQALARLVAVHARLLHRVAYSVLRHTEDAEDAVQDALVKLVRGESWRAMENERAFLAKTVWRAALDRRNARPTGLDDDTAVLRVVDGRPSPETVAAERTERSLLEELMDALTPELRETILLSAIEELSSREIGELMGVPEGTVRTRLMRARGQLKAMFDERCARDAGKRFARGREVAAGGGRR